MRALILVLIGLYGSWKLTDVESLNLVQKLFAPIGVFIFLVALLSWLISKAGLGDRSNSSGDIGGVNSDYNRGDANRGCDRGDANSDCDGGD